MKKCSLLAISLAYLSSSISLQALPETYAFKHAVQYCAKNWWYRPIQTFQKPWEIPSAATMPTPDQLADKIALKIDPKKFMRGASTSAHQCGKLCTPDICDWAKWADEKKLTKTTDPKYGMDWDKYYREYIDYAKEHLKLNALRFSIEWALVQPDGPDSFDGVALDRYADMVCHAIKKGVTPIICFHHYTNPCWFTYDKKGFEKAENIKYFVKYCDETYRHIMRRLQNNVEALKILPTINEPLWATYNAPGGYAFRSYRQKAGPPSPAGAGLGTVAEVLKNMLEAHVQVYEALKTSYTGLRLENTGIKEPKIGFLKNVMQVEPAHETWKQYFFSPLTRFILSFADMIQNGAIYNFFTNGEFQVHIPTKVNIKHTNTKAPSSLDFVGLNYYANRNMCLTQGIKPTNSDVISDNAWYYRYPQGIYRAIIDLQESLQLRERKIPMFIAENGIATKDDVKRFKFYHEYLYAINKAVQEGYPVMGYCPWTLAYNYEWPSLPDSERDYGLCKVNPDNPSILIRKKGSQSYFDFVGRMDQLEKQA